MPPITNTNRPQSAQVRQRIAASQGRPVGRKGGTIKPTASTQDFLEIEEIRDDILIMKDLSANVVIEVGAINFYLLSQEEQDAIIYAYASLLNSLSFPVQILIISKKMDISSYLEYLKRQIESQHNEILRTRLESYTNFIRNIVRKNTVLEKRFFFVVPFNRLELGIAAGNTANREHLYNRMRVALYPKRDHVVRLLARVGLKPTVMQKQELTELFYNLYNPSATGRQMAPVDTYTDIILSNG